jgi:hypothetical protein
LPVSLPVVVLPVGLNENVSRTLQG